MSETASARCPARACRRVFRITDADAGEIVACPHCQGLWRCSRLEYQITYRRLPYRLSKIQARRDA